LRRSEGIVLKRTILIAMWQFGHFDRETQSRLFPAANTVVVGRALWLPRYSITSSARASSVGGTLRAGIRALSASVALAPPPVARR
jgi:hypothetical protein